MRRTITAVAIAVLVAACGTDGAGPGPSAPPKGAYVVRSAFAIRGNQIGTGALVRVRGNRGLKKILLRISMFADGRRITSERAELPYCPASTDCLWAESLFGEHLGPRWKAIDRVRIDVLGDGGTLEQSFEIGRLEVDEHETHVTVRPAAEDGTAYLIAEQNGIPAFGVSFFIARDDERPLRYSQALFPRRPGDHVLAVFYPGPIPAGVKGPAD